MPAGAQVWDASGNLILDLTDRVGRFVGSVSIAPGEVDSIIVPEFTQGPDPQPFFTCVQPGADHQFRGPVVAYDIGTGALSWDATDVPVSTLLIYGVI
jgi:hypothetical protein